jgi:carbon starvation protein CstA
MSITIEDASGAGVLIAGIALISAQPDKLYAWLVFVGTIFIFISLTVLGLLKQEAIKKTITAKPKPDILQRVSDKHNLGTTFDKPEHNSEQLTRDKYVNLQRILFVVGTVFLLTAFITFLIR